MSRSPRLGRLVLRRLLPDDLTAAIEGDLEEGFVRRLGEGGLRRRVGALGWFWWQVATMPWWSLRRRAARARAGRSHWKPRREAWRWRRLDELLHDLRFAGRGLRRSPGFTVVAALSLGFGIGATTTLFGVIDALDFRPLPFADSGRLVFLGRSCPTCSLRTPLSEAAEWRAHARSYEDVAFWSDSEVFLLDGDVAELTEVGHASPGFLELLGVRPVLGRTFTPEDTVAGAEPVALLSHETWRRRFGGEPSVLGARIEYFVDAGLTRPQAATVIGVLPEDFRLRRERSLWVPLSWRDERRVTSYTEPVGRLRPGVTPAAATTELRGIAEGLATGDPEGSGGRDIAVRPLREVLGLGAGEGRGILFGVTALVLLIAIVNVTGLSISRALSRRGELTVRSALGASRLRLARLLLVEGVSLGLLGGAVGVLVVASSMGAARRWFELEGTGLSPAIDFRLLGFGVAVSVLAGILTALLPSVRTARADHFASLRERSGSGSSGVRGVTSVLLTVQVALALVLLTGAGVLSAEFLKLRYLDLGFDPRGLYEVSLSAMRGPPELREAPEAWRPTVEEVRRNVASVSAVTGVALEHVSAINPAVVRAEGMGGAASSEGRTPSVKAVDASYFATLRTPIIAGRGFTASDRRGEPPVAVVNATAATRFWGERTPSGGGSSWATPRASESG